LLAFALKLFSWAISIPSRSGTGDRGASLYRSAMPCCQSPEDRAQDVRHEVRVSDTYIAEVKPSEEDYFGSH
jgi:hypothetical protein